jgi:hypothetical protein
MDPKAGRVYTQEEVNAILSRAVEHQSPTDGLTHDELIDTARQAGISVDSVEAAAREVVSGRATDNADRAVAEELAIQRLRARRALFAHVVTYASVNTFLVVVNVLTVSYPWALFPILGWGIGLVLHLFAFFFPNPRRVERAREKLERRKEKVRQKRMRERRREDVHAVVGESAKEFGQAVERGVATMLAAAAKRIHEEVDRASESPPSPARRVAPSDRATRARVAEEEGEDGVEEDADAEDGEARDRRRAGRR